MRTECICNSSFKAISCSYYMHNTNKQKDTCKHIEDELTKPYPNDRKKRSYIDYYEKKGYNIFLKQGNIADSVVVQISPRLKDNEILLAGPPIFVGEYNSSGEFDINQIDKVFKENYTPEKKSFFSKYGAGVLVAGVISAAIGFAAYFCGNKQQIIQKENTTSLVTDTLSKNNTAVKDSLKIIKK